MDQQGAVRLLDRLVFHLDLLRPHDHRGEQGDRYQYVSVRSHDMSELELVNQVDSRLRGAEIVLFLGTQLGAAVGARVFLGL